MVHDAGPSSALRAPLSPLLRARERLGQAGGLVWFAARRFYDDNCFQTAASLTYTTLLAVVPLMTIGFAIFSAFPAFSALQSDIQSLIFRNLAPEIGDTLLEHVTAFMANAGRMPVFGVLGLAITAVLLIWTIEGAFSAIWRVHEPRPLVTRILSFWAIVSLAPLFGGASLSLSSTLWAAVQGEQFNGLAGGLAGAALPGAGNLLPLLVQMAGCALLYLIIPNRPVNWRDALAGGVAASVLLEISKAGFAWYMRTFPAYQTIYGALATVPIFLFWLYVAWSTLLFGAVLTAAIPDWRAGRGRAGGLSALAPGDQLVLALGILDELSRAARQGRGLRRRDLAAQLPFAVAAVEAMLELLRDGDWLAHTTRETWIVTRDLSETPLLELLTVLRLGCHGRLRGRGAPERPWFAALSALLDEAESRQAAPLATPVKRILQDGNQGCGDVNREPA